MLDHLEERHAHREEHGVPDDEFEESHKTPWDKLLQDVEDRILLQL